MARLAALYLNRVSSTGHERITIVLSDTKEATFDVEMDSFGHCFFDPYRQRSYTLDRKMIEFELVPFHIVLHF